MRTLIFTLMITSLTGCFGNWSNADLEYADALPRREDLRAKLPNSSTSQPLEGVATRRDGLMVGDPSNAWALTKKAGSDFNTLLDLVLGVVDQVRAAPPTSRTTTSRTWGPFADSNNAGREVQVVIEKTDETTFAWRIESRATGKEFIRILDGNFVATMTARKGQGTFTVHFKDFRDVVKVTDDMKKLDSLTVGYVTDMYPLRAEMLFEFAAGTTVPYSSVGYTARQQQDLSGAIRFVYTLPGPEIEEAIIDASWKSTGEGKAVGTVTKGLYSGATINECWGKTFAVTYYKESWVGGMSSGSSTDCPTIDGF
jgi:hypothetical protein